jgi:hypothetical protein
VNEKDFICVRVIGQRFELNDKQVSVIGELMPKNTEIVKKKIVIKRGTNAHL